MPNFLKISLRVFLTYVSTNYLSSTVLAKDLNEKDRNCLVIAHRGASGYMPEHTLESYALAVRLGADYIEPDLVMTKDGILISRHDNSLSSTTDVASRPEFQSRKRTAIVDEKIQTGWFSEDFTLAEIKSLRAMERVPKHRPENRRYDGKFKIATFEEILVLRKQLSEQFGRVIGVIPEIKHSTYFTNNNLKMEDLVLSILARHNLKTKNDPVIIQSFEIRNLKYLHSKSSIRLMQLLWNEGSPFDEIANGGNVTYKEMAAKSGLRKISRYAAIISPEKNHFILPKNKKEEISLSRKTNLIKISHKLGMKVMPFTFRQENHFLPANFRSSKSTETIGDLVSEILIFLNLGIDGFFTDHSDIGRLACELHNRRNTSFKDDIGDASSL